MINDKKAELKQSIKLYKEDIEIYQDDIEALKLQIKGLEAEIKSCQEKIDEKELLLGDIYDIREGIQWIDVKYDKKENSAYLYFYAEDCGKPYKIVEFEHVPEDFAINTYKKIYSGCYGGTCGVEDEFSLGDYEVL